MSCKFFSLSTYDDTRNACLHHIDERELATYLSVLYLLHDEYHPNESPTHCLRVRPTSAVTTVDAVVTTVATCYCCYYCRLLLLLLATLATCYRCHYCCSLPLMLLVTLLLPATILVRSASTGKENFRQRATYGAIDMTVRNSLPSTDRF